MIAKIIFAIGFVLASLGLSGMAALLSQTIEGIVVVGIFATGLVMWGAACALDRRTREFDRLE
jgi:hypothetical protein